MANLVEERGSLVGALVTAPGDEVLCIMASGKVVRSAVAEVSRTGRATQGVTFAKPDDGDRIIAVARSAERELDDDRAADSGQVRGDESEEGIVSPSSLGPARGGDDAVSSGDGTDSEEQA